jgi:hypothetical protein
MKYRIKFSIILQLILFHVFMLSCNAALKDPFESNKPHFNIDTLIVDIPLYFQQPSFKKIHIGLEKGLGLSSLIEGIDGEEIRIWYTHDKTDTIQMILLKNINSKWSAKLFTIIFNISNAGDSLLSLRTTAVEKVPKFGWKSLIDTLFQLNIDNLSDYTKLSGYKLNMGGDGVLVEFADTNRYRVYGYPEVSLRPSTPPFKIKAQ